VPLFINSIDKEQFSPSEGHQRWSEGQKGEKREEQENKRDGHLKEAMSGELIMLMNHYHHPTYLDFPFNIRIQLQTLVIPHLSASSF